MGWFLWSYCGNTHMMTSAAVGNIVIEFLNFFWNLVSSLKDIRKLQETSVSSETLWLYCLCWLSLCWLSLCCTSPSPIVIVVIIAVLCVCICAGLVHVCRWCVVWLDKRKEGKGRMLRVIDGCWLLKLGTCALTTSDELFNRVWRLSFHGVLEDQ